ncbi:MAG: hypothetical protein ACK4ND_02770 [Cytophagaceae bacterium]
MNKFFSIFLFLIITSFIWSCKPDKLDPEQIDIGYDYYPVEEGKYCIYEIEKTEFGAATREFSNYQLKEVIKDTLHLGGQVIHRLERFYRESADLPWKSQPDSVWTLQKTPGQIIRGENNFRYIRLVFPIEENIKWDGNSLNTISAEEYRMRKMDQPLTLGNQYFPKTISVLHKGDSSLIGKEYREEVFARGVGLAYKVTEIIEYKNTGGLIGTDTTGGVLYYQKLIGYGKE